MPRQSNNSATSYNVLLGGIQVPSGNQSTRSPSPGYAPSTPALSTHSGNPPSKPKRQCFQAFCKTFRLHILYSVWAKITNHNVAEEPKVAFHKGHGLAAVRSMIHWVPLAAAVILISFNIMQYYIGGELAGSNGQDTSKLAALQFAAKLHELLMLASIGTATFAYIREEMTFGAGVTIGTVFAGQQFSSINNLWSMEFWSTVYDAHTHGKSLKKQRWYNISPKWRMVWLIALATILGVSVGPSGAVLMRPRLEWWPAGGTDFWLNVTSDTLYADNITRDAVPKSCSQFNNDFACPYGGFESLIEQYAVLWPQMKVMGALPESIWLPGERSLRETKIFQRSSQDMNGALWRHEITWAHGPSVSIADTIAGLARLWAYAAQNAKRRQRFRFRKDASFSVKDHQPYTHAFCTPSRINLSSLEPDDFTLRFSNLSSGPMVFYEDHVFGVMSAYPKVVDVSPGSELLSWLVSALSNGTNNSVRWIDDPDFLDATNSSLLAVVALPQSNIGSPTYLSCSIRALLMPAMSRGSRINPGSISFTGRDEKKLDQDFPWKPYISLRLSSEWAEYTNPHLPAYDTDVFDRTSLAAGLSNVPPLTRPVDVPYAVESILSLMLLNGLSRLPYRTEVSGTLKDMVNPENPREGGGWTEELLPKRGLGFGGQAYEITTEAQNLSTKFQMEARVNGYAYSPKGATQTAAIAVLLIYCLLALAHIVASTSKGLSSGAWDTTPELTALAYNSEKSDAMYNTGAGIHSIRTMEQKAVVRTRHDCLELVIGSGGTYAEEVKHGNSYH